MSEKSTAEFSSDFVTKFAGLSKRLSEIGVATYSLELLHGFFGCWTLVVTKGDEAVRFYFDGKESYLTVQISPLKKWQAPNQWTNLEVKMPPKLLRGDEPISFVESFLREKFAKASN